MVYTGEEKGFGISGDLYSGNSKRNVSSISTVTEYRGSTN